MSPQIAAVVVAAGILALLAMDRDARDRTSPALWIPVVWLWIGGSRMVSQWLGMAPDASPDQILEGSPLDRNLLFGLIVLGLLVLLHRGSVVGRLIQANGVIVLFFAYSVLSTLWSDYPFVALKRWIKAFGDIVMVLVVLTDANPAAAIRRVLSRFGLLLIPVSILLIKYFPELGRGIYLYTWTWVAHGVTTGKNLLGMICLIAGLGAVWRLDQMRTSRERGKEIGPLVAQGSLFAMVLWLLWLTDSMTARVCLVLGTVVILARRSRWLTRNRGMLDVVVISVIVACAVVLFLGVGEGLLSALGRDPTLTGRTGVWEVALRFAQSPWFGTGFESFWLGERLETIWEIFWWRPIEAHNGYLEVYLNLGWVGVALFGLVLLTGYRNVISAWQREPEIGNLKLAIFVVVVVYNLTEALVRGFSPLWVLFLMAIMAVPGTAARSVARRGMKQRAFDPYEAPRARAEASPQIAKGGLAASGPRRASSLTRSAGEV